MYQPTRRNFLASAALASAGLAIARPSFGADAPATPATPTANPTPKTFKTKLHKAMIVGKISEEPLQRIKDAGFEGVECQYFTLTKDEAKAGKTIEAEAEAGRKIADKVGIRIHSVMRGWAEFNTKDKALLEKTIEDTRRSLTVASIYGADTILTVPCRVGGLEMPHPLDFRIKFDENTGHVLQVVDGDNSKYKPYIDAHNWSIDSSTEAVKGLIPFAEKANVLIALENVWNNLWVQPEIFTHFVKSFNNPWVKAYFDIGNHVKYVAPQDWIHSLGSLIVKCHVKDWRFETPDKRKGGFVHPRDGNIDWPAVRQALDDVGYNGWLSIEDGGLPLKEFNKRIDLIFAGQ